MSTGRDLHQTFQHTSLPLPLYCRQTCKREAYIKHVNIIAYHSHCTVKGHAYERTTSNTSRLPLYCHLTCIRVIYIKHFNILAYHSHCSVNRWIRVIYIKHLNILVHHCNCTVNRQACKRPTSNISKYNV